MARPTGGPQGFEEALVQSMALVTGHDPDASPVGIGLAAVSLVVMPFLSWAQRRTGRALGSNAVVADSTQTLLCTYLSAVLLVGLVLNATLGWSWADPIAGLVIAAVAVKEGLEAWRGENCGCGPVGLGADDHDTADECCSGGTCTDGCCAPNDRAADQAADQSAEQTAPAPAAFQIGRPGGDSR